LHLNILELWFDALRSPVGIVVETEDPPRLAQKLYAARAAYEGEELKNLSITMSPIAGNELWIVHGKVVIDAEGQE